MSGQMSDQSERAMPLPPREVGSAGFFASDYHNEWLVKETFRKRNQAMAHYNVLVVDDEDPVREAIRFVIEDEGHAVFEAADGMVALNMLRLATEPLVVILDLMMPHMSGLQVLQSVGRDPNLACRCAFIVASAARAFTIPELGKYLHGGYVAVLSKPFELDDLLRRVDEAGRYLDTHAAAPHDSTDITRRDAPRGR